MRLPAGTRHNARRARQLCGVCVCVCIDIAIPEERKEKRYKRRRERGGGGNEETKVFGEWAVFVKRVFVYICVWVQRLMKFARILRAGRDRDAGLRVGADDEPSFSGGQDNYGGF